MSPPRRASGKLRARLRPGLRHALRLPLRPALLADTRSHELGSLWPRRWRGGERQAGATQAIGERADAGEGLVTTHEPVGLAGDDVRDRLACSGRGIPAIACRLDRAFAHSG